MQVVQSNINTKQSFKVASLYRNLSDMLKRAFDFIVALIGLIFLSPFFGFIATLIKRDSPGPVFFWGARVGRNGRAFKMLKFRTMYEKPESYDGPRLTVAGDSRITPLGKWLRETKINELPQLWNVLIGEMSLVGPRPEDTEIAKSWPEEARSRILSIRPGITSPASILYRDEEKMLTKKGLLSEYYMSILPEKLRLDILYVDHHAFFSDLDTIFWTLSVFLPRWINIKVAEGYLFAGPFSRFANRYFSWFMIDLVVSLGVIGFSALLWRIQSPLDWGVQNILLLGVILAFLFSGVNSIAGLNRIDWSHATAEDALALVASGGCVTVLILGLNYLNSIYLWAYLRPLPPAMIIVIGLLSLAVFIIFRYRLRLLSMITDRWLSLRRNAMVLGERVLVVGDSEAVQIATWLLSRPMYRTAFSVVGVINDNDPTKKGMKVSGHWMLGGIKDIPAIIKRYDVGIILSTTPVEDREVNEYISDLCQMHNLRLIFLKDLMLMVNRQVTQPIGSFEYPVYLDGNLEFKAMHDTITGLPNAYFFFDRIKRSIAFAKRYHSRLAVLFVKIEKENITTDKLEPEYGDTQILIEVAKRLAICERGGDTLAYVGKNKFAIILENISYQNTPEVVARSIRGLLSEPIKVEELDIRIHIYINICLDTKGYGDLEAMCKAEIEVNDIAKQKAEVLPHYDIALGK